MFHKQKGFTWLEIVIYISVFILLIPVIFVFLKSQFRKIRDIQRKTDIETIKKAAEEYYDDAKCYPAGPLTCQASISLGDSVYLAKTPCDPATGEQYWYVTDGSDCPTWFHLYTTLENTEDVLISITGCTNGCGPGCAFNLGVSSINSTVVSCSP